MKETLVELQAKQIVYLEADNKELCARIAELEARNEELAAENKSLKEDVEITEAALHHEVEEHAKASTSMRKFFHKNVALTGRLKSIEEHLLYVYIHSTLDAEAELRKPEGYFSKTFYNVKVTESLEAEANLINFFSYDYFQLRRMVTLPTLD